MKSNKKPRFRKGKKAVRKWKAGTPLTGREQKMSLRYQFAILRWTMQRMIAGATTMAVAKAAMRAATGAMQIGMLQTIPIRNDDPQRAKKMKAISIAESVIYTSSFVNEAFVEAAEASRAASESFAQLSKALIDAKRGIGNYKPSTP